MKDQTDAGPVRCRSSGMQDRWNTGQERCRTGLMHDRSDAGPVGCRTGGMQERWDTGQVKYKKSWNAGQMGCRTGGMQSCQISRIENKLVPGQVGCRTSWMQVKWNTGEMICRTGGIRDRSVGMQNRSILFGKSFHPNNTRKEELTMWLQLLRLIITSSLYASRKISWHNYGKSETQKPYKIEFITLLFHSS